MLVFIDTNIFFDHWQLKNVDFTFLFNFIKNSESKLLISEVVILENENNRNKELQSQRSIINKALKDINIICKNPISVDFTEIANEYSFKDILESKIDSAFIDYIDYIAISQKDILKRAIEKTPPFKAAEKGYRDTLIWLSLLHYLKQNNITEEVAFISANSDDFYNNQKTDFKNELSQDITFLNLKCKINVFNSLFRFIDKNVLDSDLLEEYELDNVDDQIQKQTISLLNDWTAEQLRDSVGYKYSPLANLLTIKSHEFEIIEGVEDPVILKAKRLQGPKVYVHYEYNFRIVALKVTISQEEFNTKLDLLKNIGNNYESDEGNIEIEVYPRIYFTSSFEYDTRSKIIDGLTISGVRYKI